MNIRSSAVLACVAAVVITASPVSADTMCDPSYQNCRVPLVTLIDSERDRIDVLSWFFEDWRYVAALTRAQNRGVRIRVLANDRWPTHNRGTILRALRDAGIPVRIKTTSGMAHTKAMIFHGQMTVEHGGANFSSFAFVPEIPYANYTDEVIQFNTDPAITRSFMASFDDLWIGKHFKDFSNASNPQRAYQAMARDTRLQVSTPENPHEFYQRVRDAIDMEPIAIDIIMYRITSIGIRDALIRAHRRGVRVRILTDPTSANFKTHPQVEKALRDVGISVRRRVHAGLTHQKMAVFHGQYLLVFGSQNYTETEYAIEHNLFDVYPPNVRWAVQHFDRKWNAPAEFK